MDLLAFGCLSPACIYWTRFIVWSGGEREEGQGRPDSRTNGRTDRQAARLIDNIDTDACNCNADYIMIYVNWRGRHETLKGDHMGKMRVLILFVV